MNSNNQQSLEQTIIEQSALLEQIRQVKKEVQADPLDNILKFKLSLLMNQYDSYTEIIKGLETL